MNILEPIWIIFMRSRDFMIHQILNRINIKTSRRKRSPIPRQTLQWRYNERDGVSNHRRLDSLFNRLFRRRLKKTSKLRVTGLCEGNSPVTGEFPAQRASNLENVSLWWRHHNRICFVRAISYMMSIISIENFVYSQTLTMKLCCYVIYHALELPNHGIKEHIYQKIKPLQRNNGSDTSGST